jgi:phage-related protein
LRAFAPYAKSSLGRELRRVQLGLMPRDWKPMTDVGAGVVEIRVRTAVAHRMIYVAKYPEAIYVLHAFEKRSQRTSQRDLAITRRRLAEVVRRRGQP